MNRKIYFMCPDISAPAGGVKMMYQLVDILNKNNIEAYMLHTKRNFRIKYWEGVNRNYIRNMEDTVTLDENDILFIPEQEIEFMMKTKDMTCTRVAFVQNWAYFLPNFLRFNIPLNKSKYQEFGIKHVLASSDVIKTFVDYTMNSGKDKLEIGRVDYFIEDIFKPKPLKDKKLQIAYMPRKNKHNLDQIIPTLSMRIPNIKFVSIDNMNQEQVAKVLNESAIYLSTGYPEGFGIPPVEAMKSGCIVIGYTGWGGDDYADDVVTALETDNPNMFVYPDGEVYYLSKKLEDIWNDISKIIKDKLDKTYYEDIINSAIETAKKYNIKNTEKQIIEYIKSL